MKKLALLGAAVVLGLLAMNASASTTSDYSVLSISLTVTTNSGAINSGNTTKYVTKSYALTTSALLQLFEGPDFANTTFPAGSKIVVGWDWADDVLVIDKNNNILFNAATNSDAYFKVSFTDGYGAYSQNKLNSNPGHFDWSNLTSGSFVLYDDISMYIDLFGDGPGTFSVNQNLDAQGDTSSYSHSESLNAYGSSFPESVNGFYNVSVKAKITGTGSGKGETYLY